MKKSQYELLEPFLDPLLELSHWKRKPKDPCFNGIEMSSRVHDILKKMHLLLNKIEKNKIFFPKHGVKVLKRVILSLEKYRNTQIELISQLETIYNYLKRIKEILSNNEQDAETGLNMLQDLSISLANRSPMGSIEAKFVKSFQKYINTKGKLLLNYRTVSGAPSTNNFQELKFKQLKHFLRRTIGHNAAKSYFLVHGEHIVYVDPKLNRNGISLILKSSNQTKYREQIRLNRRKMDTWIILVHNKKKWDKSMEEIDKYILNLEMNPKRRL